MQSSGLDPPLDFDFGVQRPKKIKQKKIVAADGSGDGRESKEELLFGLIFFCLTCAANFQLLRQIKSWGGLCPVGCSHVAIYTQDTVRLYLYQTHLRANKNLFGGYLSIFFFFFLFLMSVKKCLSGNY